MVAVPLLRVAVPPTVPAVTLSKTVTVPVELAGLTVMVRVTVWPKFAGLGAAERVTVPLGALMISVIPPEVLGLSALSPPYEAVKEWLPTVRVEVVKVAVPLTRVAVPMAAPPSRKVTVPVAVEGTTKAFKLTGWPDGAGFGETERLVWVAVAA